MLKKTSGSGDDPVPWTLDGQPVASRKPIKKAAKLSGTLTNVASLRSTQAHLPRGKSFAYDLTTDGPATISLSDGRKIALPASGHAVGTLPG